MGCCPGGLHYLALSITVVLREVLQVSSRAQVRSQEGGIEELLHGHVTAVLPCTKEVMIILPSADDL